MRSGSEPTICDFVVLRWTKDLVYQNAKHTIQAWWDFRFHIVFVFWYHRWLSTVYHITVTSICLYLRATQTLAPFWMVSILQFYLQLMENWFYSPANLDFITVVFTKTMSSTSLKPPNILCFITFVNRICTSWLYAEKYHENIINRVVQFLYGVSQKVTPKRLALASANLHRVAHTGWAKLSDTTLHFCL